MEALGINGKLGGNVKILLLDVFAPSVAADRRYVFRSNDTFACNSRCLLLF